MKKHYFFIFIISSNILFGMERPPRVSSLTKKIQSKSRIAEMRTWAEDKWEGFKHNMILTGMVVSLAIHAVREGTQGSAEENREEIFPGMVAATLRHQARNEQAEWAGYAPKSKTVCKLACGHFFHQECISRYIKENKTNCPLCRQDLALPGETIVLTGCSSDEYSKEENCVICQCCINWIP